MINFDDVRKTDKTTFFFFPDGMHDMLAHFLKLNGFTEGRDFRILSYDETRRKYPNIEIPMVPCRPSMAQYPEAYDEPVTMISCMNVEDLERKLWELDGSDEALAWEDEREETLLAEEQAREDRLKGWLPGLRRESEDVR